MNHLKNIGALKDDYEAGINSKVYIANKHGISAVTLWRYARKGKWSYGKISLAQEKMMRLKRNTNKMFKILLIFSLNQ